jgi:hypothetical protein
VRVFYKIQKQLKRNNRLSTYMGIYVDKLYFKSEGIMGTIWDSASF